MNINILVLIMLWTVAPFFKKWAMLSMSSSQYLVFQSLIILPLNCLRGYSNDKQTILSPSFNMWFFLGVFGTWLASVIFMLLCKELNPTDFIPVVQPAVIVLTNIIDILFGMEIKSKNIIGSCFLVIGLYIINTKDATKTIKHGSNINSNKTFNV